MTRRGAAGDRRRAASGDSAAARLILGVPERFMKPFLVFMAAAIALTLFGLLMVYSSSSVTSLLNESLNNNPAHYLTNQGAYMSIGLVAAALLCFFDYHQFKGRFARAALLVSVVLLALVFAPQSGQDAYGASRWVGFGRFTMQPSELVKPIFVLMGARLLEAYFGTGEITGRDLTRFGALGIGVPLLLILLQPDKGTVAIIVATLFVMALLADCPKGILLGLVAVAMAGIIALSVLDSYSRARIVTAWNPWADPFGDGYQLIQGFYAFGSGGLLGVGIGMGRQKYSYLPMAHNDFIFAVIGEECGLLGTLGVLLGFALLLWAGLRIAKNAPDLAGQLIASGSVTMLVIQLLLNVTGVIGLFPLSGKPIPFISYGGSSIIATLLLVGLVASVFRQSVRAFSENDERRRDWIVSEAGNVWVGQPSEAGEPTSRSQRGASQAAGTTFTVLGGGQGQEAPRGRSVRDASGRRRIDLGPSASDRLRTRNEGPRVRGARDAGTRGDRRGR
ncbi:FtsW/RodA/SpoVE family cell cycle protein [Olsenella urininfantis]|uniref:FtsW/RodA/SpoVE family cell cycle protein n=1 Tax=Olsenella urininfantis TaxID=1871033 RepID=UPI000985AB8A|nr:putative peptidoglycan glycosyltransferase FtsW [Olsenella urininfantis]